MRPSPQQKREEDEKRRGKYDKVDTREEDVEHDASDENDDEDEDDEADLKRIATADDLHFGRGPSKVVKTDVKTTQSDDDSMIEGIDIEQIDGLRDSQQDIDRQLMTSIDSNKSRLSLSSVQSRTSGSSAQSLNQSRERLLKERKQFSASAEPVLVNAGSGRDYYSRSVENALQPKPVLRPHLPLDTIPEVRPQSAPLESEINLSGQLRKPLSTANMATFSNGGGLRKIDSHDSISGELYGGLGNQKSLSEFNYNRSLHNLLSTHDSFRYGHGDVPVISTHIHPDDRFPSHAPSSYDVDDMLPPRRSHSPGGGLSTTHNPQYSTRRHVLNGQEQLKESIDLSGLSLQRMRELTGR